MRRVNTQASMTSHARIIFREIRRENWMAEGGEKRSMMRGQNERDRRTFHNDHCIAKSRGGKYHRVFRYMERSDDKNETSMLYRVLNII